MTSVSVRGLTKIFYDESRGEFRAVDAVDFECRPGEIVGLLGPNGAGKTTTLRMLATILKPTAGSATVASYDIQEQSLEVRKRLGFLTGSTGLYGRLTPVEIFHFFGHLHKMPDHLIEERTKYLL